MRRPSHMTSLRLARRLAAFTPRTRQLLGTTAASYLARVASAAVLLLTIPMARRLLEADRFGLWMMLGSLLAFLSFIDLGIGNGLMNRVSVALHRGHHSEVARTMIAGYFCTLACGLLLCGLWLAWLLLAADPLRFAGHLAPAHDSEARWAFSTFIVLVALGLPIQITQKLQLAHQQGHWIGLAQLAAALGTLVVLPAGLWFGLNLPGLLLCSLGLQVLVTGGSALAWLARMGQFPLLRQARLEGVPAALGRRDDQPADGGAPRGTRDPDPHGEPPAGAANQAPLGAARAGQGGRRATPRRT